MKKVIIVFCNLLICTLGFSQGFITNTNDLRDERPMEIKEFDGFYLVAGNIKSGNYSKSYLLKYSKGGKIIKQAELDSLTTVFASFKKGSNKIILIRSKTSGNTPSGLLYSIIDTNLNFQYESFYSFPDSLYISGLKARMMNDSSIIVAGFTNKLNAQVSLAPFYFKLNLMGDSINSIFLNSYGHSRGYDILDINNSYYFFNSNLCSTCSLGTMVKTSHDLVIKDTINIADGLYDLFSPILINDSTIQIFTRKNNSTKLYLSRIDTNGIKKSQLAIGVEGEPYYPAMQNGMVNYIDISYILYTEKFSFNSPFFGNGNSSKIVLTKFQDNLDTVFSKRFSVNKYLSAWAINSTSDGGCIFVATENDTINHNNNRDILIVKVDSNGIINWIKNIEQPIHEIKVYPNPATTHITLDLGAQNQRIETLNIFTITGQKVISLTHVNSSKSIDIQKLKSGIYLLEGILESGERFVGKFVKE
jgi:hypothetical protein